MKIAIITDYLGRLGSKQRSKRYRQGMDLDIVLKVLNDFNVETKVFDYSNCLTLLKIKDPYFIIYNSSEDPGEYYKSFIEDNIKLLSKSQHSCIPKEDYLRAHNNKIYMEMLRINLKLDDCELFDSKFIATQKELLSLKLNYPVVIKGASGAMSRSVKLARNQKELISHFYALCSSNSFKIKLKEYIRRYRHRGSYSPEALKRGKCVIQNFISGVLFDWKILVYYNRVFALKRKNRPNDFRASGSGLFSYEKNIPSEILDLALQTRIRMNVPHLSLDIAMTDSGPVIFEFQVIGFGTKTIEFAPFYFVKTSSCWKLIEEKPNLEMTYTESLISFLNEKKSDYENK